MESLVVEGKSLTQQTFNRKLLLTQQLTYYKRANYFKLARRLCTEGNDARLELVKLFFTNGCCFVVQTVKFLMYFSRLHCTVEVYTTCSVILKFILLLTCPNCLFLVSRPSFHQSNIGAGSSLHCFTSLDI